MKDKLIKIGKFLMEYDFLWSVPSVFTVFVLFPYLGEYLFGDGFAFYPPSFFHAGIYAVALAILFNGATQMFIYFNFQDIYQYYLGEGFNQLPQWLRVTVFLFLYSFCFCSLLFMWSQIV